MRLNFVVLFSFLFAACATTGPSSILTIKPGTYTGTFSITNYVGSDSASTQHSQTTFTFTDNGSYACGGGLVPTGGGRYDVKGDSLYLLDTLGRVAIGDWTLVLSGSFYAATNGDELTLTQDDKAHHRYRNIDIIRQ